MASGTCKYNEKRGRRGGRRQEGEERMLHGKREGDGGGKGWRGKGYVPHVKILHFLSKVTLLLTLDPIGTVLISCCQWYNLLHYD